MRPVGAEQQFVEVGAAVRWQTADLAVQDAIVRTHRVRDFLDELRPMLERAATARDELAAVAAQDRQRAEAIELGLEEEVGMIEPLRDPEEPQG